MLREIAQSVDVLITVEDHVRTGGLGSAVAEFLKDERLETHLVRLGIPDEHVPHGDPKAQHERYGYGPTGIRRTLESLGFATREVLEASD